MPFSLWQHPRASRRERRCARICARSNKFLLASRNRDALLAAARATPQALLELLKRTDAFRRPERFAELLEAARLAAPGLDVARVERALAAAAAVDAGAIAASASSAQAIPRLLDHARSRAIAEAQ